VGTIIHTKKNFKRVPNTVLIIFSVIVIILMRADYGSSSDLTVEDTRQFFKMFLNLNVSLLSPKRHCTSFLEIL